MRGPGLVEPEEEMTGEGEHLTADCFHPKKGCRGTESQTFLRSTQLKDKKQQTQAGTQDTLIRHRKNNIHTRTVSTGAD